MENYDPCKTIKIEGYKKDDATLRYILSQHRIERLQIATSLIAARITSADYYPASPVVKDMVRWALRTADVLLEELDKCDSAQCQDCCKDCKNEG